MVLEGNKRLGVWPRHVDAKPFSEEDIMCRRLALLASFAFLLSVVLTSGLSAADPDLVGWWKLDGDTTDSSDGNNGTIVGTPQWVAGYRGGGVQLGGADYITLGSLPGLPSGTSARSLCGWAKPNALDTAWETIVAYGSPASGQVISLVTQNNTLIGSAWGNDISNTKVWVAGEWQHATVTYDGTTASLYHNGILVASGAKSWSLVLKEGLIGSQVGAPNALFKGVIDDVRIYRRALTESEIQQIMQGAPVATQPRPADKATDVPMDADLSWTPGPFAQTHNVYCGTVKADVNNASAANPLGILVSRGQTATTYTPTTPLQYGQTYYWRVDEVNAPPDATVFKGEVWSFTVEPVGYPLPSRSVTASASSSASTDEGPEGTVDRSGLDNADLHSAQKADMWLSSATDPNTPWITFTFDGVYKLYQMLVWNHNSELELSVGLGIKKAIIEYSVDSVKWTTLGETHEFARAPGAAGYAFNTTIDLGGAVARYVRIRAQSNWGNGLLPQYGLSEVRFLYVPMRAREPKPASGTTGVLPQTLLTWRAGRGAASHDVYFGTDPNGLALAATVSEPSCEVPLNLDKTYYWKVNEVNTAADPSIWAGDVWSFSTAKYLIVDDFESYNNNSPRRVFQAWIDGAGFSPDEFFPQGNNGNGSGALVGYDPTLGSIMEKTIKHGGAQSMPLNFDNSGVSFSEATRTWTTAQNWTASGIKSLSIYFAGAVGNSGKLYVKINGKKVLYDGDATDIARAFWQPWNIDLSVVGGDQGKVTTLTIGVEGAGAKGIVYIDDICLYPRVPEMIVPTEPKATNLVGYYTLDDNANDSSGNGFNGQEKGSPTYDAGVVGKAIKLDGADDYVDIGNPPTWPSGKTPVSMCMWAATSRIGAGYGIAAAYGTPAAGKCVCIGRNGTGLVGSGWGGDLTLPGLWKVDEWHHICLSYDGTTARLYADGIEVVSGVRNWNLALSQARIGSQIGGGAFWQGSIDDLRVYGRLLSADEIAWLAGRRTPMHKPF